MTRVRALALPLAILLLGAAPAPAGKTLYFARPYDPFRWCGYTSKAAQDLALRDSHGGESVRATYVAGRITRLTYETYPESGDWAVTDTYRVSGRRLWLERSVGLTQGGGIEVIERGSARIGRRIQLSVFSAKRTNGGKLARGDWFDPPVDVARDLEKLEFAPLGRTMLRRRLSKLCAS